MKKSLFLKLFAFAVLFSTCNVMQFTIIKAGEAIDCEKCCKQGRFVDAACCKACNGCDMYGGDQTAQECRDFPA